jgi:hypothetical protein
MNDQLVAETSTSQHATLTTDRHPCCPVRLKPTISASERPQTYALDHAATWIDKYYPRVWNISSLAFDFFG